MGLPKLSGIVILLIALFFAVGIAIGYTAGGLACANTYGFTGFKILG
jgi:hypothetical protein